MDSPEIQKIHQLLGAKDDTSRFVGLLLLKTTLDSHAPDLQHDQVAALWNSISPRFLDRLVRTGSRPDLGQRKQHGDMLDVAVAVIYTFTKLLNNCAVNERFYARIPDLTGAVLNSSKETTRRIVDIIYELVQQPEGHPVGGATCLAGLEVNDWAPLIEVAPQYETIFSMFHWTWSKGGAVVPAQTMRTKIDEALRLFISSFKGHDPTPLLDFVVLVLDNLNPDLRPLNPRWLQPLIRLIHGMASSRQTADSRRAYTHCAAALLDAYPEQVPTPLFSDDPSSSKPIAYLFVKMVHADILSALHTLIPKSGTVEYFSLSRRIAAALDIMTSFAGFLIAVADDIDAQKALTPERILNLHKDFVVMIGDVMEYLGDRWDAFLVGTRSIESKETAGTSIFEDPIIPAAVRLIATWLLDDDGESLRAQASSLIGLFAELYAMNRISTDMPELRLPIMAALEGILQTSDGQEAFKNTDILSRCLYPDLWALLTSEDVAFTTVDYIRGTAIIQIIHILIENDKNPQSYPALMTLLESIEKYDVKPTHMEANVVDRPRLEFQTDALELAVKLLDTSSGDITPALQQKTKNTLKTVASKVMRNWGILNDEDMVAKVADLCLD
ncbi:Neurochondrin-domain-containing protein [Xylaria intraflava]|nr:Neurochondrin-domain-containing protein [Xylaria intraflava]